MNNKNISQEFQNQSLSEITDDGEFNQLNSNSSQKGTFQDKIIVLHVLMPLGSINGLRT